MTRLFTRALLALSLFAPLAALAASAADQVAVNDARARAMPKVAPASGAFLTLTNNDSVDHAVVAAECPSVKAAELHTHIHDGGVMRMRRIERIDLPAGQTVTLQPGGLHIMLIGLQQDLTAGAQLPLTLVFEDGSRRELQVPVKEVAPGHMMRQGMPMGGQGDMPMGHQHHMMQ
jgi:copper(I)-binding protein